VNEELNSLESLLDELLAGIQSVLQSGEVLSDEFQGMLAQELDNTFNHIEQLKTQQSGLISPESANPSSDAQLLWVLSGQQPQAFISYLRSFPTPATAQLANNPTQLNATIVQLQQMMPAGQPPVIDGVPHADLNSSNIWGANYDPGTGRMLVRFQGGSEYEYDGVPENIFKAFIKGNASARSDGKNKYGQWWVGKNPSLGAALNQYIKAGGFPYRKIK
jgi:hypothetical protein